MEAQQTKPQTQEEMLIDDLATQVRRLTRLSLRMAADLERIEESALERCDTDDDENGRPIPNDWMDVVTIAQIGLGKVG